MRKWPRLLIEMCVPISLVHVNVALLIKANYLFVWLWNAGTLEGRRGLIYPQLVDEGSSRGWARQEGNRRNSKKIEQQNIHFDSTCMTSTYPLNGEYRVEKRHLLAICLFYLQFLARSRILYTVCLIFSIVLYIIEYTSHLKRYPLFAKQKQYFSLTWVEIT